MLRARLISFCIAAVFVLGSAHFFLMNGLQFIFVITGQPTSETYWNMQYVLEVFEMMTPLIMGYYLIYMVYRLGFIDEEDVLTMEISSHLSDLE